MAFVASLSGRVYVLKWTTAPELVDVNRLGHELPATRRQAGEPLVALSVIPAGLGMPNGETRRAMVKRQHMWTDNCMAVYVVLGDTSFPGTLLRVVLAELALVSKRGVVKIFPTVDPAIAEMAARLGEEPRGLRHRIDQTGVLSL